jgi:hypothetical protein
MTYGFVGEWWTDAGTFESLVRASNLRALGQERPQATALAS